MRDSKPGVGPKNITQRTLAEQAKKSVDISAQLGYTDRGVKTEPALAGAKRRDDT